VIKQGKPGKFKAKKAKPISDDGSHRPGAVYDSSNKTFAAAWDEGPRDVAAGRLAGASDIRLRRVRANTGKGKGPTMTRGAAGETNLTPYFFPAGFTAGDDDYGLLWAHGPADSSPVARVDFSVSGHIGQNIVWDETADADELLSGLRGPVEVTDVYKFHHHDELAVGLTSCANPNSPTAYLYGVHNFRTNPTKKGPFNTPAFFPLQATGQQQYSGGLNMAYAGIGTYCEGGRTWVEYHMAPTWQRESRGTLGGFFNSTCETTPLTIRNAYRINNHRVPRDDAVYVATALANGKVQLFMMDDAGIGTGRDLFEHDGNILEMTLVIFFDSNQALLLWVEKKNNSNHEIFGFPFKLNG